MDKHERPTKAEMGQYVLEVDHDVYRLKRIPNKGKRIGSRVYNHTLMMKGFIVKEIDHLHVRVVYDYDYNYADPEDVKLSDIWFIYDETILDDIMDELDKLDTSKPAQLKKYLRLIDELAQREEEQ